MGESERLGHPIIFPPEEEMKLRDDDKAWLTDEIAHQLRNLIDSFKPHGWRHLVHLLRELGPIIGTCTFVLGLIAAVITLAIFGFSGRTEEATFRGRTEERLKNIESSLREIVAGLTKQSLVNHAALPLAEFKATLPDLNSTISAARNQNVRVSPIVLADLTQKMTVADKNAPQFWQTAAELISYKSSLAISPEQGKKLLTEKIPDCTESLPTSMTIKQVPSPNEAIPNRGFYENCRFVIDSAKQDQALNTILQSKTPFVTFKNCLIEYHGGEISLILAWDKKPFTMIIVGRGPEDPSRIIPTTISGPAIQFENCLFNFSFQTSPSPNGQSLTATLLAQNAASVSLPVSP